MVRFLGVLAGGVFLLILLIILTQDFQVYAELMHRQLGGPRQFTPPPAGSGATDGFVRTSDGQSIHFRRWPAQGPPQSFLRTAILSHGNAGTMDGYYTIPQWLATLGITSYVYDYRGYGQSTGWPSEQGIYRDAEAVWNLARTQDNASPGTTLVFGHSLGGGPSAYLAEKHGMGVLMSAASYTSVPDRAALHPYFGKLAPFVWTEFPNRQRISHLTQTCLIVLHGHADDTMPPAMAQRLISAYHGSNRALFAEHPTAGHGDIISYVPELAGPLLSQCLPSP